MRAALGTVGAILLVLGVLLAGFGTWLAGGTIHGLLFDNAAEGRIVSSEIEWASGTMGRGRALHRPVVAFTDRQGRRHQFTDPVSQTPTPESGSRVRVWYDPDNPQQARIAANRLWMSGLGLVQVLGGGLCLLLGAPMLWFARRARRSSHR